VWNFPCSVDVCSSFSLEPDLILAQYWSGTMYACAYSDLFVNSLASRFQEEGVCLSDVLLLHLQGYRSHSNPDQIADAEAAAAGHAAAPAVAAFAAGLSMNAAPLGIPQPALAHRISSSCTSAGSGHDELEQEQHAGDSIGQTGVEHAAGLPDGVQQATAVLQQLHLVQQLQQGQYNAAFVEQVRHCRRREVAVHRREQHVARHQGLFTCRSCACRMFAHLSTGGDLSH
jgi:hypothetical protein